MAEHAQRGWSPRERRVRPVYERHLAEHARRGGGLLFGQEDLMVRRTAEGDREIVAAHGQLDLSTAWKLERELRRAEAGDVLEIVLDLSGLEFIDSVGMDVVIHASARSRHHTKRLRIRPGPKAVHRAFELSGLLSLLPFEDPQPAVAHL